VEGFVAVNGVRLQYLDWGGSGPALILIHGLAANPYVFHDLAPAFTDRFHVIAYARRGCGGSEVRGPYDLRTLTEDLRGLMDALHISKADLVGHSAGGDEITEMATRYPPRVGHVIYLDAAYDMAGPDFRAAQKALPAGFLIPPPEAMRSLETFIAYQRASLYSELDDPSRVEANIRQKVILQADGTVEPRIPKELVDAFYTALLNNKRRDYTGVHCPILAMYAEHIYDLHNPLARRREELGDYERTYWKPLQQKSIEQLRREQPQAQIVSIPDAHGNFFLLHRQEVVTLMRRFLE